MILAHEENKQITALEKGNDTNKHFFSPFQMVRVKFMAKDYLVDFLMVSSEGTGPSDFSRYFHIDDLGLQDLLKELCGKLCTVRHINLNYESDCK